MGLQEQIITQSANKAVLKANVTGKINLKKLLLFTILRKYINFATNENAFVSRRKDLLDKAYELKNAYPNLICNYKTVLPPVSVTQIDSPSQPVTSITVDAADFTVTDIIPETLFGIGAEIDTYHLKKSDFDAVYSDNNDNKFYSIVLYRDDLDGAMLKYSESAISGQIYGESAVPIEIQYNDIE